MKIIIDDCCTKNEDGSRTEFNIQSINQSYGLKNCKCTKPNKNVLENDESKKTQEKLQGIMLLKYIDSIKLYHSLF